MNRSSSSFSYMFNRPALLVSHAVISVGVVCIALAAGIVAPRLDWLVPTTAEVTASLWTAVLAAVLGSYLVTVSRAQGPDIGEIIERAKRQLGDELWSLARRSALEHDADPVLVGGILIVESLQRPQWLRFLERLKGIAIKEGSYGVMQVQASRPISDEESIKLAVSQHLAGKQVPRTVEGDIQWEPLEHLIAAYNPDRRFVELASEVITHLESEGASSS